MRIRASPRNNTCEDGLHCFLPSFISSCALFSSPLPLPLSLMLCASLCMWICGLCLHLCLPPSMCPLPLWASSQPLAPAAMSSPSEGLTSDPGHYLSHGRPLLSEPDPPTWEGNQAFACIQGKADQECRLGLEGPRTRVHPLPQTSGDQPASARQAGISASRVSPCTAAIQ